MSFDKIEHETGRLYKVKFYCVYIKIISLTESFLGSKRLCPAGN